MIKCNQPFMSSLLFSSDSSLFFSWNQKSCSCYCTALAYSSTYVVIGIRSYFGKLVQFFRLVCARSPTDSKSR